MTSNFNENYCAYPFVQVSINPVVKYISALDRSRGISVYDYIPELKGHL
jgi:hypothetical protein